jgi:DNA-directed RNA polymerase II subunit RPB4
MDVVSELTPCFLLPGSLCCDSADECKTMIPSLADKISDEDLQELLDEMAKLMSN